MVRGAEESISAEVPCADQNLRHSLFGEVCSLLSTSECSCQSTTHTTNPGLLHAYTRPTSCQIVPVLLIWCGFQTCSIFTLVWEFFLWADHRPRREGSQIPGTLITIHKHHPPPAGHHRTTALPFLFPGNAGLTSDFAHKAGADQDYCYLLPATLEILAFIQAFTGFIYASTMSDLAYVGRPGEDTDLLCVEVAALGAAVTAPSSVGTVPPKTVTPSLCGKGGGWQTPPLHETDTTQEEFLRALLLKTDAYRPRHESLRCMENEGLRNPSKA